MAKLRGGQDHSYRRVVGEYGHVNGIDMYYEVSGNGEPLVLLHGAVGGAFAWEGQVAELAGLYRVVVPEARGRDGPVMSRVLSPTS